MFKVLDKDLKVITVYGIRNQDSRYDTEFLVYGNMGWTWSYASNYKPVTKE